MKTLIFTTLVMIGLGLTVVTGVSGQIGQVYRANIPFDFVINDGAMNAGEYQLTPLSPTQCNRVILIRNLKEPNSKVLGSASCGNAVADFDFHGTLTFWKNVDKFILVRVDTPTMQMKMKGAWTDVQILSSAGKAPEIVTIALK